MLSDPALSLVKSLVNIDEMWLRLQKAYGDPKILLNQKLSNIRQKGSMWQLKYSERLQESIMSLIIGFYVTSLNIITSKANYNTAMALT